MSETNDIMVSVDMGDAYEATPRIAAAIVELAEAIAEAHGADEVEGFGAGLRVGSPGGGSILQIGWSPGTGVLVGDEVLSELRRNRGGDRGILPTGETGRF